MHGFLGANGCVQRALCDPTKTVALGPAVMGGSHSLGATPHRGHNLRSDRAEGRRQSLPDRLEGRPRGPRSSPRASLSPRACSDRPCRRTSTPFALGVEARHVRPPQLIGPLVTIVPACAGSPCTGHWHSRDAVASPRPSTASALSVFPRALHRSGSSSPVRSAALHPRLLLRAIFSLTHPRHRAL